ncbi:hypothetical protein ACFQJ7_13745 [Halovenus rubra]|uniref:Uncharacterized protein n=2 Tax=Halovenus rubra TaxID=869890 RepID=A0ACC7DZR4_9EURY|nr:hypothetical protein [Halovenus rubra]
MNVGKLLGYLLLSLVDALLAPVFVFAGCLLVLPPRTYEELLVYVVGIAGLSFVGAWIAALICVVRGGDVFPITRGTAAIFARTGRWLWP